jgi:hypothetical protein
VRGRLRGAGRYVAASAVALLPAVSAAAGTSLGERVDLALETELHWALGTGRGRTQQAELIFQPEVGIDLTERLRLVAIGRFRTDAVDELEPGSPSQREASHLSRRALVGDQTELELREFYVETTLGRAYLTLGKQQVVWGTSDGLKVLDVVNPQSFREFVLDEFEDSRIPLWTLNAEIPVRDFMVQLLWIPDPSYHELPGTDGLYAFTAPIFFPKPPPGVAVDQRSLERPRRLLTDSDAGARVSTFWKGWDLTLNYFYYYDDFPVPFRRISATVQGPLITVTPRYERTHLVGGTFSNAFGDLTVRGELGYSTDRFFATSDPTDSDGVVETGEFAYVVGFDWYGFSEALLSAQVFQIWLTEDERGSVRDPLETVVSFVARREFLNDRLAIEVLWLQAFNHADGLVQSKIGYQLSDTVEIRVGLDLFYGSRHGLFGQFDPNDRLTLSLEWSI